MIIDEHADTRRTPAAGRAMPLGAAYPASRRARAAVFVTSTERLSHEQRQCNGQADAEDEARSASPSVLTAVHWARLVCDEGHFLGGGALTNATVVAQSPT